MVFKGAPSCGRSDYTHQISQFLSRIPTLKNTVLNPPCKNLNFNR